MNTILFALIAAACAVYAPVKVGMVQTQGRVAYDTAHPSPQDKALNLALMAEKVALLAAQGAKVVVFPELFLSGYNIGDVIPQSAEFRDGPAYETVRQIAITNNVTIVYGFPEKRRIHGASCTHIKNFNAQNVVFEDGTLLATYEKTHLYGTIEKTYFTPGDNLYQDPVEIYGLKWSFLICYDVEFPEAARIRKLQGADVLVVSTANMVPWDVVSRITVPSRAYENNMFVLYVNHVGTDLGTATSGGSLTWAALTVAADPLGNLLAMFSATEEQDGVITLDKQYYVDWLGGWEYTQDRRPEIYDPITSGL